MLPCVELKIQTYIQSALKDRLREEHELQISSLTTTITELSKSLRKASGFSSNLRCKKMVLKKKKSDGLRIGSSLMFFCCGFVFGKVFSF